MPFSIETNKNLAKAIVRAYKVQNFNYKNLVNADAIHKVQRRYDNELFKNKILKITMKKGININSLFKKMNKTKFKDTYVNLLRPIRTKLRSKTNGNFRGPGVFRYKIANEHWIIYHPEEIIKHIREGKGEYLKNRLSN